MLSKFPKQLAITALLISTLTAIAGSDPKPTDIVNAHLKAIGGAKAYKAIQSTRFEAIIKLPAQGIELEAIFFAKRGNYSRQEINFQGQTIVQATDGENAWVINPLAGSSEPQAMPDVTAGFFNRQASFDDLFFDNPKKKNIKLSYAGKEEKDGVHHHVIEVTFADGHQQRRFYNTETKLLAHIQQNQPDQTGSMVESVISYSDYKEVSGRKFPHKVTVSLGQEVVLTKVEVNHDLEETLFQMAAGQD